MRWLHLRRRFHKVAADWLRLPYNPARERVNGSHVVPMVVLPAALRQKQRHALIAVVVVRAKPRPLDQRPEGLNAVDMYVALNGFVRVVDYGVLVVSSFIPAGGVFV